MPRRACGCAAIASYALIHDRTIASRVDDSVVRVMAGEPRLLRRARGYAPAPVRLPERHGDGAGRAGVRRRAEGDVLPGQGRRGDPLPAPGRSRRTPRLSTITAATSRFTPSCSTTSRRRSSPTATPNIFRPSSRAARAAATACRSIEVQHHHAHVAACLAENSLSARRARPCSESSSTASAAATTARSGAGSSCSRTIAATERLGALQAGRHAGGAQAVREPWRNLYAHLMAEMGWAAFVDEFRRT